jgi:hypothetical protein
VVEIRPLSAGNQDGFLAFMAAKAFETNPNWAGCFCQFYLDSQSDIDGVELTAERNRQKACDRISSGQMRGYLAFDGDEVVGWIAANKANNSRSCPQHLNKPPESCVSWLNQNIRVRVWRLSF